MRKGVLFILVISSLQLGMKWGFYAHQQINTLAIYTLPPPLNRFYKAHAQYISENAVNPDKRRYAVQDEAPRHFIDLDVYPDSLQKVLIQNWKNVIQIIPEDTLTKYGIVPWHIMMMKYRLTQAFLQKNAFKILQLSTEIGHYIADANVPLHTTQNYNGQMTGQYGIHGLWESRLPELFAEKYDFFVGKASYLDDPQTTAWDAILVAHAALDSVLNFEKILNTSFQPDKKYSMEDRGSQMIKAYSREYAKAYHKMLDGMVERQMRSSILLIGSFWYTCWVDAGMPDLAEFENFSLSDLEKENLEREKKSWGIRLFKVRDENDN